MFVVSPAPASSVDPGPAVVAQSHHHPLATTLHLQEMAATKTPPVHLSGGQDGGPGAVDHLHHLHLSGDPGRVIVETNMIYYYDMALPHMTNRLWFDPIFERGKIDSVYKYLEVRILRLDHKLHSLAGSKSSDRISINKLKYVPVSSETHLNAVPSLHIIIKGCFSSSPQDPVPEW